jgi:hypothetical protein
MPGRPHHSDKWHSCVQKVMAKGDHDMQSAAAICTQSLQDAGTPIFEGAESRSLLEIKMLSEFYPQVIADALRAAANPEGINQYTSGGSHAKDAKEVSNSAYQASTKANEKRGTGQEKADRHSDAAAAHGKAADAHAAASKAAKTSITKDYHNQLAASHRAQAENHTRAAGIFAGLEGNNLREIRLLGATGQVRTEMVDGREHLVVPVIALMEGVIHAVNAEVPEFGLCADEGRSLVGREAYRRRASEDERPAMLGLDAWDDRGARLRHHSLVVDEGQQTDAGGARRPAAPEDAQTGTVACRPPRE